MEGTTGDQAGAGTWESESGCAMYAGFQEKTWGQGGK